MAPAAVAPVPATAPVQAAGPVAEQNGLVQYWPWLAAAGALLLAALVLLALRRRRSGYEEQEVYYDEPALVEAAEPVYAAPVAAAAAEEASVSEPDSADMAALAAASEPAPDRPWLEFLMRPVRAGTRQDEAMVEFELTVGNTGSAPARDVRVSTWMVAAGEGTEMERSLIDPPADAVRSELSIAPGDGALVEGVMALSKDGLHDSGPSGRGRRRALYPAGRKRGPHPRVVRDRPARRRGARALPGRPREHHRKCRGPAAR